MTKACMTGGRSSKHILATRAQTINNQAEQSDEINLLVIYHNDNHCLDEESYSRTYEAFYPQQVPGEHIKEDIEHKPEELLCS